MPRDAKDVSVEVETMTDTLEKLLEVQFPIMIPLAAFHLQLTHPNQPTV